MSFSIDSNNICCICEEQYSTKSPLTYSCGCKVHVECFEKSYYTGIFHDHMFVMHPSFVESENVHPEKLENVPEDVEQSVRNAYNKILKKGSKNAWPEGAIRATINCLSKKFSEYQVESLNGILLDEQAKELAFLAAYGDSFPDAPLKESELVFLSHQIYYIEDTYTPFNSVSIKKLLLENKRNEYREIFIDTYRVYEDEYIEKRPQKISNAAQAFYDKKRGTNKLQDLLNLQGKELSSKKKFSITSKYDGKKYIFKGKELMVFINHLYELDQDTST